MNYPHISGPRSLIASCNFFSSACAFICQVAQLTSNESNTVQQISFRCWSDWNTLQYRICIYTWNWLCMMMWQIIMCIAINIMCNDHAIINHQKYLFRVKCNGTFWCRFGCTEFCVQPHSPAVLHGESLSFPAPSGALELRRSVTVTYFRPSAALTLQWSTPCYLFTSINFHSVREKPWNTGILWIPIDSRLQIYLKIQYMGMGR